KAPGTDGQAKLSKLRRAGKSGHQGESAVHDLEQCPPAPGWRQVLDLPKRRQSLPCGGAIRRRRPQPKIDIAEPNRPEISGRGSHCLHHVMDQLICSRNGVDAFEQHNWPPETGLLRLESLPNSVKISPWNSMPGVWARLRRALWANR